MKKGIIIAISVIITVVIFVSGFLYVQKADENTGKEQGYLHGYTLGYTDALNDRWGGQQLAAEINPYEPGSGKWKYFLMYFSEGYNDGHSAGEAYKK